MSALAIRDDISSDELRRYARRESNGRVRTRRIALANALDGMDRARAARLAGRDRQTLRDWVHRYNAEGIAGLRDRPKPGRTPKLSEGQMASLKAIVLTGPGTGRRQDRALARRRFVPLCRGTLGCPLQRDRDAAPAVVTRLVAPQDPAAPSAERRDGPASLQKGGFAAGLSEIAAAHPAAQRFEIWSQRCYGASGEGMAPSSR